jgi:YD repeat-containing protein
VAVLVGFAVLASLLTAGSWWYWDGCCREHIDFYANVTKRWGLPEGVGHLNAEQVSRRNVSVALVRRGRRNPADEVRLVNSAGHTPPLGKYVAILTLDLNPLSSPGSEGPQSAELLQVTRVTFSRDSGGRVLEQTGFTRSGRRLYTIHFPEPGIGEYKREGFGTLVRESGISYLRFVRVQTGANAGLEEKVLYFDDKQQPQPDENGAFGYHSILNSMGLVKESINLGPDGEHKVNNYGVLKDVRSYDDLGDLTEATTFDELGSPKSSRLGPASTHADYDRVGNATRFSFYDAAGQPVVVPAMRAFSYSLTYDQRGNMTSQTFFGPDQKLIVGVFGFAKQLIEWQGANRSLTRFYGANERPTPAFGGAFENLETWDDRGYPIETTFRDDRGAATRVENGCATIHMTYDDAGNITELKCLNEQLAPTSSTGGFSIARYTYDAFGNELTTAYYDVQGGPGLLGDTYASIRRVYNALGKVDKETYLDARGRPVKTRQGFAAVTSQYDARGNQVAILNWDEHGSRAMGVRGFSGTHSTFNERGLEVETVYLDSSDRPVQCDEGYAIVRRDYDQRGFIKLIHFFGKDGRPTRSADGYASVDIKRNAAGQRLELAYFDERNAPMIAGRFGSARRRFTYDGAGGLIELSDHDATGKAITNAYGYSVLRYFYDDHGRETGRELLDTEGRQLEFKVAVDRINASSTAAAVGLKVGDFILTYDGQPVSTSYQFTNQLERFKGDQTRELRIQRAQLELSLDVPPGRLDGLELAERVSANPTVRQTSSAMR